MSESVKRWRANTKQKLVECCGGKCNRCGYNKCLNALDFHHREKHLKEFGIGNVMSNPRKREYIVEEIKKCVLLCCLCHRELHSGIWKLEEIEIIEPFGFDKFKKEIKPTGKCPICCGDVFGTRTCSRSCAAKKRIKCEWPSKENLLKLKQEKSRVRIAEMLGVSEAAVRKHEKKIGIF